MICFLETMQDSNHEKDNCNILIYPECLHTKKKEKKTHADIQQR